MAGGLGVVFFGPAFLILLWALVRPNYLIVDGDGLRFRLYSVETHPRKQFSRRYGEPVPMYRPHPHLALDVRRKD